MFSASVDALERFLMEQARKTVAVSNLLHHLHNELVVVNSNIDGFKDRSKLMLRRSNLVVFSLCWNSELPEFFI